MEKSYMSHTDFFVPFTFIYGKEHPEHSNISFCVPWKKESGWVNDDRTFPFCQWFSPFSALCNPLIFYLSTLWKCLCFAIHNTYVSSNLCICDPVCLLQNAWAVVKEHLLPVSALHPVSQKMRDDSEWKQTRQRQRWWRKRWREKKWV